MTKPSPSRILFRPAAPSDAEQIAEVYLASRKTHVAFAPLTHSDESIRAWVAEDLIPTGEVTVAVETERPDIILGMLALARRGDAGWIEHLYLQPSLVGAGLGTRLLDRAKAELGPPIRLYTFQANAGACRFYERHGFRAIAHGEGSGNEENCPDVLYEWMDLK